MNFNLKRKNIFITIHYIYKNKETSTLLAIYLKNKFRFFLCYGCNALFFNIIFLFVYVSFIFLSTVFFVIYILSIYMQNTQGRHLYEFLFLICSCVGGCHLYLYMYVKKEKNKKTTSMMHFLNITFISQHNNSWI